MAALVAIKYVRGSLQLLDQRLLPFEEVWLDVPTPQVRASNWLVLRAAGGGAHERPAA
jgi:hypothetical protein